MNDSPKYVFTKMLDGIKDPIIEIDNVSKNDICKVFATTPLYE